jgi:Zn-dependent peptidase ImmA (M78 family)/DNA-binding XRE family transcriptional regulator
VNFNPSRLSVARKRAMLNKKTLAERLGVQLHTIVRWERCQTEPSDENIDALARVLGFPKEFFFGPDIDEPIHSLTSFRSQKAMSAASRDAALAAGAIGFRILDWVGDRFDLPEPNIPDLSSFAPEEASEALRQDWALGEAPISNMIQLLESKGVRVFSLAENTKTVNAYSLRRSDGTPCVFLNTFKSAECSRFDAAHELAHLALHQDGSVTGRAAEDQANAFASAFLIPKRDVISVIPRAEHLQQLLIAKRRWRVSVAALAYRLHKLGIISDWKYRDFCVEMSKKGYHRREPNGIARERSVVWEKVLKNLWAEKTTQNDIAQALDLPILEVDDLLFGVLNFADDPPGKPTPPNRPLKVVPNGPLELPRVSA